MSRARKTSTQPTCSRCGRQPCGCPPLAALATRLAAREAGRRDLHTQMTDRLLREHADR